MRLAAALVLSLACAACSEPERVTLVPGVFELGMESLQDDSGKRALTSGTLILLDGPVAPESRSERFANFAHDVHLRDSSNACITWYIGGGDRLFYFLEWNPTDQLPLSFSAVGFHYRLELDLLPPVSRHMRGSLDLRHSRGTWSHKLSVRWVPTPTEGACLREFTAFAEQVESRL